MPGWARSGKNVSNSCPTRFVIASPAASRVPSYSQWSGFSTTQSATPPTDQAVHLADEGRLRVGHRRLSPAAGRQRWVGRRDRVRRPALVADDPRAGPAGPDLEAGLPEDLVRGEERDVGAGRDRCLDPRAHRPRPVLEVARHHDQAPPIDQPGVQLEVDVGDVLHVPALALHPADELELPAPQVAGTPVEGMGAVERHGGRAVALGGRHRCLGDVGVEVEAAPCVVALPGRGGAHEQDGRPSRAPSLRAGGSPGHWRSTARPRHGGPRAASRWARRPGRWSRGRGSIGPRPCRSADRSSQPAGGPMRCRDRSAGDGLPRRRTSRGGTTPR